MIINSYVRTYEGEKGLVNLEVIESDLSGVNVKMLVRYADQRPDQALAQQPKLDFLTTVNYFDVQFNEQVKSL